MFFPSLILAFLAQSPATVQDVPETLGTGPASSAVRTPNPFPPLIATQPFPSSGAADVSIGVDLAWGYARGADAYEVYFGTNPAPTPADLVLTTQSRSFDPGLLALDTTYYWRVDTVNSVATTTGNIWSFTTVAGPGGSLVFDDGFESGDYSAGGWATANGIPRVRAEAAFAGVYGGELRQTTWIEKALDTTGLDVVHVAYARRTVGLTGSDSLIVEWFDGSSWNTLEDTQDTAWSVMSFDLGAAADNPAFRLRFRTDAVASGTFAYLDEVAVLDAQPVSILESSLDFGVVEQAHSRELPVHLVNIGPQARATTVRFQYGASSMGVGFDFSVEVAGVRYHGAQTSVAHAIDLVLPPQSITPVSVFFEPTEHLDDALGLEFIGTFPDSLPVALRGSGSANPSWGFLHPVLEHAPTLVVDYDDDGSESVQILGNDSHTHEIGRSITGYDWRKDGTPVSTATDFVHTLPLGPTELELTITDDSAHPTSASDGMTIDVHPPRDVPGVLAYYYHDPVNGPQSLLDNVPSSADYIEPLFDTRVTQQNAMVGSSPFAADVMVRLSARFDLVVPQIMEFAPVGGTETRVEIDGMSISGPQQLAIGKHDLEVRFAVIGIADLPLDLDVYVAGQLDPDFATALTHDRVGIVPIVHGMPPAGTPFGGNPIVIEGFGFYPPSDVVVHWGSIGDYSVGFGNLEWISGEEVRLVSPAATDGTVALVTVETPAGVSTARMFEYTSSRPLPIAWTNKPHIPIPRPTAAEWGPDGRLWVATIHGRLFAITFDDDYDATSIDEYAGIDLAAPNDSILGLTFNPFDDPTAPVRVYVSHAQLFAQGSGCLTQPSPFPARVSTLVGPNFDAPTVVIDNLPTSNHDHSVNAILFDHNGDLFICQGGNTNAGIRACALGDLPESPLSGALLKARTSAPSFDGVIEYADSVNAQPVHDQRLGENVDVVAGDIEVYAAGMRNPWDAVLTTRGLLYGTDNGPNFNFGTASLSCSSAGAAPEQSDELNLLERGNYYGHPNRSRGRYDYRQCKYRDQTGPPLGGIFTQALTSLESSSNGLVEYRANAFGGAMLGTLVAQKFNGRPRVMALADDGRSVVSVEDQLIDETQLAGLDVTTGPGGALIATDYLGNHVEVIIPNDLGAVGLTPYDIFPWRAPAIGGQRFHIGGAGFGTLANTTVSIGGHAAPLSEVRPGRITGTIPVNPGGATGLVDVVVTVGQTSETLEEAFRFLANAPGLELGTWTATPDMPATLSEVAALIIGRRMYVFGEGSNASFVYDIYAGVWSSSPAVRPFAGHHHAAEVKGQNLYLFGGIGSGSGKVQIYNVPGNSWTQGADMPWNGGSCGSAEIAGRLFVCGGLVGNTTVGNLSVYEPISDTWDPGGALQPMPTPVHHAASATDGQKLYVFGGRSGGHTSGPGLSAVQVYDPVTGQWDTSRTPMPLPRAGAGRAVCYFGEFYVMGGEDGAQVFDDVQVYDPVRDTWRLEESLPAARHGIYPARFENRIFVTGGSDAPGTSASDRVETFSRL